MSSPTCKFRLLGGQGKDRKVGKNERETYSSILSPLNPCSQPQTSSIIALIKKVNQRAILPLSPSLSSLAPLKNVPATAADFFLGAAAFFFSAGLVAFFVGAATAFFVTTFLLTGAVMVEAGGALAALAARALGLRGTT